MARIRYRSGYKYQLAEDYVVVTGIDSCEVETRYLVLGADGRLLVRAGYAWDGPSGPTVDTANFMRGSLVHDALYQLIRDGHLPTSKREEHRKTADALLRQICRADGMSALRAWWVYKGVRLFGGAAIQKDGGRPLNEAP